MVESATFMADLFYFIKSDLASNITDPIAATRGSSSQFVMTSYPKKSVEYPLITIKTKDVKAKRAGMQTTNMDLTFNVEIRVWARNEKEKDTLFTNILNRLKNIQFTTTTGSEANGLHDFTILSSVEIDEDGDQGIKSRIVELNYKFFNI